MPGSVRALFARRAAWWPHVRAALLLAHGLVVVLLALPGRGMTSRAAWQSENLRSDFAGWAGALRSIGVPVEDAELASRTEHIARGYASFRSKVIGPLGPYATATGARQGWAMFASPQRHPAELHVDVREGGKWRPLFRPRSPEYRWFADQLDHHRLRKLGGRFARGFNRQVYDDLASYLAKRAWADFPRAERVRVRLYSWDALSASEVRAGKKPDGDYTERREFRRPGASTR